jgi:hypothetical protein
LIGFEAGLAARLTAEPEPMLMWFARIVIAKGGLSHLVVVAARLAEHRIELSPIAVLREDSR